jgi:hypothetical protein
MKVFGPFFALSHIPEHVVHDVIFFRACNLGTDALCARLFILGWLAFVHGPRARPGRAAWRGCARA